jgi:hypothetical protein
MCHDTQIPDSEDDHPARRVFVTVSKLPERKVTMDVKDKQRAAIEFLL